MFSVLLEKQKDPTSTLLSDFDMAMMQDASAEDKYGLVGTKGYTAPELGSMDYDNKVNDTPSVATLFFGYTHCDAKQHTLWVHLLYWCMKLSLTENTV